MLLYLIRHADPIYETDSLTDRGKLQAEALSKRLAKTGLDRIFCSPLGRAKDTAEYTCKLLGLEKTIEEWAREVHVSKMESEVELVKANGEAFLERLGYKREGNAYRILKNNTERVALFCHAAFIIVWLSDMLNIPLNVVLDSFTVTHTGITVIEFPDNLNSITIPRLLCFSDVSHLYAENLDLLHCNKTEL
ncbi:MAG: histidine phosphatase family protein [Clostridia bacterium]|nr:histidine phosphatase family protein [Clostridia bacterium]